MIPQHELKSLQPLTNHDNLTRRKQDELYAELDKLCPERLIRSKRPDRPPDDCLPVIAEITGHFYKLVIAIAKRYHYRRGSLELDDLVQAGYFGLHKGVFLFDNRKNLRVSTYVTWWIHQKIRRTISNQGRTIRIPVHVDRQLGQMNRYISEYQKENGRFPGAEDIADHTNIKPGRIGDLLKVNYITDTESLDKEVITDGDPSTYYDYYLFKDANIDEYQYIENEDLRYSLDDALAKLTAREERLLRMRFGLHPYEAPMFLQEIANKFGFTRERARQIEAEAFEKLRALNCVNILAEFLTDKQN